MWCRDEPASEGNSRTLIIGPFFNSMDFIDPTSAHFPEWTTETVVFVYIHVCVCV